MPIYKFKNLKELEEAIRRGEVPGEFIFEPDENYYRKVLIENEPLIHVDIPRGVHKFKTLEEADRWLMKFLIKKSVRK